MKLELLERKAVGNAGSQRYKFPVLFVHGAGTSAICWEKFLEYFSSAGCDAYAMSLRGHGGSDSPGGIAVTGYNKYVDDIRQCVERIGCPVILVGHSWGGYILQKYLERFHDSPGAALIASAPPATSLPAYWRMFKMFPWLVTVAHLTARPHYVYSTKKSIKALLYHPDTSAELVNHHAENLQPISTLLYLQTIFSPPNSKRIDTKLLVVGGEKDVVYTPDLIAETGNAYGCPSVMIPDVGHMMMLETRWEKPAEKLLRWVRGV